MITSGKPVILIAPEQFDFSKENFHSMKYVLSLELANEDNSMEGVSRRDLTSSRETNDDNSMKVVLSGNL